MNQIKKKDIYIIRNTVNDMCYVGQSVDYLYRFRKHCEEARRGTYKNRYKSYLYNAMNEIGIDKFYVELLESQVENYNEMEKYYIEKFNTIRPNGYNLTEGGEGYPNLAGIEHHGAKVKDQETLDNIIHELKNTKYSLTEIGEHYDLSYNIIFDINNGYTYKIDGIEYPIREFTMSKEKLDRLIYDLKYSNYTYDEIAELYAVSKSHVKAVNYGISQHKDYLEYPLRKVCFSGTDEEYELIQKDLLSTNLSYEQLGDKYECSEATIRRVNKGETAFNKNLQYPLRKLGKLSSSDVYEIHQLLIKDELSINEISKKYNVSDETIKRINSGKTKKYIDERYTYPLRK